MMSRLPARIVAALLLICVFLSAPAVTLATKKPPVHPIDINSASSAQLQEVPGIGPATADKILQMRKSYGAFKSVDDLLSVRGIGPKKLEKMRKYLVAGHSAPKPKAGATGTRSSTMPAMPGGCAKCSRAPTTSTSNATSGKKSTIVAPKTAAKSSSGSTETVDSDEEPE